MKIEGAFIRSRVARRIVALFVLSALLPIGAMAVFAFGHVRNLLVEQAHMQLAQLSESYGSTLYERMLAVDHQLRSTAAAYQQGMRFSPEVRERLRTQFVAIAVREPDGTAHLLLGAEPDVRPYPVGAQAHLRSGESVVVSRVDEIGRPHVYLMRPIRVGVPASPMLIVEIDNEYLWGAAGTFPAFTDYCVVDDAAVILFCTLPNVPEAIRNFAAEPRKLAAGRFDYAVAGERQITDYREIFLAPRFFVHGWTVVASRPEAAALAPIIAFRKLFLPTAALALLVVALLSITQVRRTLIPLERLIDATRRAANKDFTARVEVRGGDEFGELAESFNSMASRLGSQFTALMTLADIDRAILSRLDVDRVLETVVMRMRDIVPADFVSVAVLDHSSTDMLRIYTRDQRAERTVELERSAWSQADNDELLAHPQGCWVDATTAARPYTSAVRRLGAVSVFVLPIVWKETAVGAVVLGFDRVGALDEEERSRARDLGDRVGVAIATAVKDEQLYFQAHYDSLTQLPNRLYFKDQLARRLALAQRDRRRFALLFIDLDHFKNVNDSYGHAEGDEVLRQAADRLRNCVREVDAVARLGGDEFTVILPEMKSARDAELVANKVIRAMVVPFAVSGQEHFLNASIGIALYPADGTTVDDLLRNADTAMYRAKESGRGRAVYFEERMNAAAQARVTFERDMRHAIEHGQFVLHYQPQLWASDGNVAGVEALLRWNHPQRGLLSPLNFIQLAEETGLIEPLGEWVLRTACAQFVRWRAQGVIIPRVAVNVSPRQFRQQGFLARVRAILAETGMRADCLELEITESLLMDANRNVELTLTNLSVMGVRLALDDFGTGYSSLAYLKRFPVNIVKIDRSFVKDLPEDESSGAITGAIIAMSHALHKEVVAEGVADQDQLAFLRGLRCDLVQGFHLSRPLPAAELESFVRSLHPTAPAEQARAA